ncbi:MAG: hypothetical protein HY619_02845 [Thaumarchaeota archaeon]|nr:hypothetical protein [Nitrososphaerota archaeon]
MLARSFGSREIAVIALLSSASIASSYAMYPLPNVKLMDVIVFVAAYCFGLPVGLSVAAVSRLVYGTINPYGFAGFPLLIILVAAEEVYAVFGWFLRRFSRLERIPGVRGSYGNYVMLAVAGGFSALIYDIITNAATGLLAYPNLGPVQAILIGLLTMNFPIPMGVLHQVSNILIFAALAPALITTVQRVSNWRWN